MRLEGSRTVADSCGCKLSFSGVLRWQLNCVLQTEAAGVIELHTQLTIDRSNDLPLQEQGSRAVQPATGQIPFQEACAKAAKGG